MATDWDKIMASGDCIDYERYNTMVIYIKQSPPSGANAWNSHNYNNSGLVWDDSLKKFKAMKSGGGSGDLTQSTADGRYKPSTGTWHFASSQKISGGRYVGVRISGAKDLNNWNSIAWNNSGLIWDNSIQKWKPYKSGASVVDTFLELTDTPSSYASEAWKVPVVNAAETALVFADIVCTATDVVVQNGYVVWAV